MPSRCALLLLVPFVGSCGALMSLGPCRVPVDSEPRGATVVYDGEVVGRTPCVVAMHGTRASFELRHPGCHARRVDVGTAPNPWFACNLLSCGLTGFVDLALGTHVVLVDDPVKVHLAEVDGTAYGAWIRTLPTAEPWSRPPEWTGFDVLLYTAAIAGQLVYDHNR